MAHIRDDFEGVTIIRDLVGRDHVLSAGGVVPDGLTVGSHLLAATERKAEKPALKIPAKGGPGSGAPAWRKYAAEATKAAGLNIEIPDEASRDDIIDALNAADIPTE